MSCVDYLVELFETRGDAEYLGEPVSQKEHALQCAELVLQDGAPDALVAAALLHDIGHLLPGDDSAQPGADPMHEEKASAWLRSYFDWDVTEPIRLHVIAKRYLCTIQPSYFERLSQASIESLALQGGRLSSDQAEAFESETHFQAALRVRRWDEAAKNPARVVPELKTYVPLLRRLHYAVT
jgi:gamma-butyrobetaine dioxygenase